jgi:hypothetical protein
MANSTNLGLGKTLMGAISLRKKIEEKKVLWDETVCSTVF